jgi:hypothetical protein
MSAILNLSSRQLRHIADLKEKIDSLQHELSRLVGGTASLHTSVPGRKYRMSASARARIAAAQRKRWAKFNKTRKAAKTSGRSRRRLSAAARAKIAAAARARWVKAKAAGKTKL